MNSSNTQVSPVALVTGGARRIGAAIVKVLHQAGFRVVIHCHHSTREANALANDLNDRRPKSAWVIAADLGLEETPGMLIAQTIAWGKQLDVLVNNASLFVRSDIHASAANEWDPLFNINVKAPYLLSKTAYPELAKTQGVIINLTDIHAQKPLSDYAVYCQTKAALVMQTKSLARAFAPDVRVNAVAPGAIAWPEGENVLNDTLQQQIVTQTPLKRHGDPIYIAQAVLALVSNDFVTGQILSVDGGRSLT